MTMPLFDAEPEPPPLAARLAPSLRSLADRGVYVGTSSWKYEGWLGQVYTPGRYATRGKFSKKKFDDECLKEYAAIFPTVCGDFAFYQFPSPDYWRRLFDGLPPSFRFAFKVPEEITVARWPGHARYGSRAGQENQGFLNVGLFQALFARRLEPYAAQVGPLIFEFGTFNKQTFPSVADFLGPLHAFFSALPGGFRYAVEIRNPEYLSPEYFDTLARHHVAHAFNAWTRMPTLADQMSLPDAYTADFTVVRALLQRGRSYEQAVQQFEPYRQLQQPDAGSRDAMRQLTERAVREKKPAFLFVNNRLEGCAPETIEAIVSGTF